MSNFDDALFDDFAIACASAQVFVIRNIRPRPVCEVKPEHQALGWMIFDREHERHHHDHD